MALISRTLDELASEIAPSSKAGLPPVRSFAPSTKEEAAAILTAASDERATVVPYGSGTHQGIGHPVDPDVLISTENLADVEVWEPDDLTLVAGPGVRIGDVEERLATRAQTAAMPETQPDATIGGLIAADVSGFRRARFGPTRDRMLEVTLATGDGRIVRAGGRVVKNVSGYDLPRLVPGSLGALGLIVSVCLKLWPVPSTSATIRVDDAATAWRNTYRPLAALDTDQGAFLYLQGPPELVDAQAARSGGERRDGLQWPTFPTGEVGFALGLSPADVTEAVSRLEPSDRYVAQHGVGRVDVGSDTVTSARLVDLRRWAESKGGRVTITHGTVPGFDPWGTPPPGLALQRRLIGAFDPLRVINPGRLPGGL